MFAIEQSANDCPVSVVGALFLPEAGPGLVTSFRMVLRIEFIIGSSPLSNKLNAVYPTCFSEYFGDLTSCNTSA
jgi:hypothetical protein